MLIQYAIHFSNHVAIQGSSGQLVIVALTMAVGFAAPPVCLELGLTDPSDEGNRSDPHESLVQLRILWFHKIVMLLSTFFLKRQVAYHLSQVFFVLVRLLLILRIFGG